MTDRSEYSAVVRQARRDKLFPPCRIVSYKSCVSDIHGTCHFPGVNTGASLANREWLKIT